MHLYNLKISFKSWINTANFCEESIYFGFCLIFLKKLLFSEGHLKAISFLTLTLFFLHLHKSHKELAVLMNNSVVLYLHKIQSHFSEISLKYANYYKQIYANLYLLLEVLDDFPFLFNWKYKWIIYLFQKIYNECQKRCNNVFFALLWFY